MDKLKWRHQSTDKTKLEIFYYRNAQSFEHSEMQSSKKEKARRGQNRNNLYFNCATKMLPYKDSRCDTCKHAAAKFGFSDCDECPRCLVKRRWCLGVAKRQEQLRRTRVCSTFNCHEVSRLVEDKDDLGVFYCCSCWDEWELDMCENCETEQELVEMQRRAAADVEAKFQKQKLEKEWPTPPSSMDMDTSPIDEEKELRLAKLQLDLAKSSEQRVPNSPTSGSLLATTTTTKSQPPPETSPSSATADLFATPGLFGKDAMVWDFSAPPGRPFEYNDNGT